MFWECENHRFEFFCNHDIDLRGNSTRILERDKALRSLWKYEKNTSLRLFLKKKSGDRHYVYHFVDPDLRFEISSKKKGLQKRGPWNKGLRHLWMFALGFYRKLNAELVFFFIFIFRWQKKEKLLKALLSLNPWLLNLSD